MGYNLVSLWTPSVGGAGDDAYLLPDNTEWERGAISYSIPPTIAEIDAGDHMNQIIAAYNRRAYFYNTTFGSTLKIFPYLQDTTANIPSTATGASSSGDFITVTTSAAHGLVGGETVYLKPSSGVYRTFVVYDAPTTTTFRIVHMSVALSGTGDVIPTNDVSALFILSLSDAINDMRAAEGLTAYTFSTAEFIVGAEIEGSHIFELRKSLRIAGILTTAEVGNARYAGRSTAGGYPTFTGVFAYTVGFVGSEEIGKLGQVTYMSRERILLSYAIPEWYIIADTAIVRAVFSAKTESLEAIAAIDLYKSSTTDFPVDTGTENDPNNLDSLEHSWNAPANTSHDFDVDVSDLALNADNYASFILGTKDELDGTGLATNVNGIRSMINVNSGTQLIIDFGT